MNSSAVMRNIDYRGAAALIIATCLGVAIVTSVIALAWRDRAFSEVGGEALVAIGGALVGALAGYMGRGVVDKKNDNEHE